MKNLVERRGFFNEIRPVGRVKSPAAVKSLWGEIPLRGVTDGFHYEQCE
ncbi:MAG: hypothetical protein IJJ85_12145 [Clostridia bacterium]|nr:hypothetical protein [Clostridia bacterium]